MLFIFFTLFFDNFPDYMHYVAVGNNLSVEPSITEVNNSDVPVITNRLRMTGEVTHIENSDEPNGVKS